MNIVIIILAISGLVHSVNRFKEVIDKSKKEKITVDIKTESLLFFICIFELIRIIFYT